HHAALGALGGADAAGKVHLRHHPAAEDVTRGIGVGRHGQRPQRQIAEWLSVSVMHHGKILQPLPWLHPYQRGCHVASFAESESAPLQRSLFSQAMPEATATR